MHFPGFLLPALSLCQLFLPVFFLPPALSLGHFIELTEMSTTKRLSIPIFV